MLESLESQSICRAVYEPKYLSQKITFRRLARRWTHSRYQGSASTGLLCETLAETWVVVGLNCRSYGEREGFEAWCLLAAVVELGRLQAWQLKIVIEVSKEVGPAGALVRNSWWQWCCHPW